jgi:hypothetical protein
VAFSPDGAMLLTARCDHTARLWSVQTPVEGAVNRVGLWAQVVASAELDDNDIPPAARAYRGGRTMVEERDSLGESACKR